MGSSITFDLCSFWSTGPTLDVGNWWQTLLLLGGGPCIQTGRWVANLMARLLGEGDNMVTYGEGFVVRREENLNKKAET